MNSIRRLLSVLLAVLIAPSFAARAQLSDFAELSAKAAQGNAEAQFKLGVRYHYGEAVPQNYSEALKWFQKAAEQGFAPAQSELGYMHEQGHGTIVNFDEAMKWYRKAADQGLPLGLNNVGSMYDQGRGVSQNLVETAKWFRQAAEQGLSVAQRNFGNALAQGRGVKQDYVEAYKWLRLAVIQGNAHARDGIREISLRMTADEIAEARRRADEFRKSRGEPTRASGSGFFVTEDGFFITNFHVVRDATRIIIRTDAGNLPAQLVAADKVNDLALLKTDGAFKSLPLSSSRDTKLGDAVFTVGFPNIHMQGTAPKLTDGKISSIVGLEDDPRFFQVNVAIQPGNSGGALVNERGNVIGVITLRMTESVAYQRTGALPQNVNFAVKSAYALALLESQPAVIARLKHPQMSKRKFADAVKAATDAAALVFAD
ncbi:MAG: tetratricopeptide repeat-containing serine protease family protein [Verrucomicrobia bacterium]|nr:tetratricopeptide repeat-containing serine protease family protein [Verrucomicrobiota bacterium]